LGGCAHFLSARPFLLLRFRVLTGCAVKLLIGTGLYRTRPADVRRQCRITEVNQTESRYAYCGRLGSLSGAEEGMGGADSAVAGSALAVTGADAAAAFADLVAAGLAETAGFFRFFAA
jgi:hypothetical protein